MIVFLSIYGFMIIGFLIHYYRLPPPSRTRSKVIELILLYLIVFGVGLTSFLAFIGLTFLEDIVVQHLVWPKCPFMQELANVNLAFGVLGIMAIWFRKSFWIAIVVGFSIWIFGDAIHHLIDAYVRHNYSPGNVGALVYTDIIIPILLCIALYFYIKTLKTKELGLTD